MTFNPACIHIVAGLPRSGTSLMMQMLVAGGLEPLTDGVRVSDDDNPRGYFEYEPVKRTSKDGAWLDSAPGKVVKMVHLLLRDLPADRSYRVIFMKRDLREVVSSQAVMLRRSGRSGANLSEDALVTAFERQLREIEGWLEEQPNFQSRLVSYNELMREAPPIIDALNQFLGGDLDTQRMLEVIEPSLYRQRVS